MTYFINSCIHFYWHMQFEPESFVDGLLGIGIAGGGASKSEGKALATRLSQMRKERNERAKRTASIKNVQQPSQSPMGLNNNIGNLMDSMSDIEADMGEMELITPGRGGGAGGGAGSKGKSKNKKKKKGKR